LVARKHDLLDSEMDSLLPNLKSSPK
jgi:hypothetical protein